MSLRLTACQMNNWVSYRNCHTADDHNTYYTANNRCKQNTIGTVSISLPFSAGNQCRNCHIYRSEKRQTNKFWLSSQANCCNRIGSQSTYHKGVYHQHQCNKKRLQNSRPRNLQCPCYQPFIFFYFYHTSYRLFNIIMSSPQNNNPHSSPAPDSHSTHNPPYKTCPDSHAGTLLLPDDADPADFSNYSSA